MAIPLLTSTEIRDAEAQAYRTLPAGTLMERAGAAAAHWIQQHFHGEEPVWILAGPGNNGGDGWVVGLRMHEAGSRPVVLCADPDAPLPQDAALARQRYLAAGGAVKTTWSDSPSPRLIVDTLFGIGLSRNPGEPYAEWIRLASRSGYPVVSLDLPSGLDGDTGLALDPCIQATHTLTFIADKPGLHTADGPDHCGAITVFDLGLPVRTATGHLLEGSLLQQDWPRRRHNTHKGNFGAVGILGGSRGMTGAALLAAEAALKTGAGRVWLAALDPDFAGMAVLRAPELMEAPPETLLQQPALTVLVAGPGMGHSARAAQLLEQALALPCALVLDADALNLIGRHPEWADRIRARTGPTLMTPHPAEARRLLPQAPAGRLPTALAIARTFRSLVVLKGCGSIIATPESLWWINPTGNAGLSAPGMGDILAGALGALLGQGLSPLQALQIAVHTHGAAADDCVLQGTGPVGLTASEVTDALRQRLNSRL